MDAPRKPRLSTIAHCTACGKTSEHTRRDEEDPWTCMVCGAVERKKKNNGDGHHVGVSPEVRS